MPRRRKTIAAHPSPRQARAGDPGVVDDVLPASPNAVFLRSLEVFLAVVQCKSFSGAATRLGIAQPTVTARIQGLEESLKVVLLDRSPNYVRITEAGATLQSYAERLLALRDEMLFEINGRASSTYGRLRIIASTTCGNYVLPPLLPGFHRRFPGLRMTVEMSDSSDVLEQIDAGSGEIGVLGYGSTDERFECVPFLEDEIVAIAQPGHPCLARAAVSLEELTGYPWITRESGSGTRRIVEERLRQLRPDRPIPLSVVMELGGTEAIKSAVRCGLGIALVSSRSVVNEVAVGLLGSTQVTDEGLRRQFLLARSRRRTLSPPGQALWDHLLGIGRLEPHSDPATPER